MGEPDSRSSKGWEGRSFEEDSGVNTGDDFRHVASGLHPEVRHGADEEDVSEEMVGIPRIYWKNPLSKKEQLKIAPAAPNERKSSAVLWWQIRHQKENSNGGGGVNKEDKPNERRRGGEEDCGTEWSNSKNRQRRFVAPGIQRPRQ